MSQERYQGMDVYNILHYPQSIDVTMCSTYRQIIEFHNIVLFVYRINAEEHSTVIKIYNREWQKNRQSWTGL